MQTSRNAASSSGQTALCRKRDVETWLVLRRPRPLAKVRLFCFHHAGGNALAYRRWVGDLPDWIDVCPVQLPGRSGRIEDPAYTTMAPLVEDFTTAIAPLCNMPVMLFGHSMGAAVAFAVAQKLENFVSHLFVAGRRAPQQPNKTALHALNDNELTAYMRRLGGTPEIVFSEPELMAHVLDVLRRDLELNHAFRPESPLKKTPITAFGGTNDSEVAEADVAAWSRMTGGRFEHVMLPGNHFFHFDAAAVIHQHIVTCGELSRP